MSVLRPAMPLSAPAGRRTARIPAVDVARGLAILAMAAYHASWDLDALGLAAFDLFGNPLWLTARTAILGGFLTLAGVGLVLADSGGIDARRYGRRLGWLVAAAAAVSAMSYVVFPDSPIFFGVLHHMALASVLGLAFLRLPWWLTAALGVGAWLLPSVAAAPPFDAPALRWLGLMTFAPNSNDYVPLFPWFGIYLGGVALGRLWGGRGAVAAWRPAGAPGRALAWAGRHSLPIYLIHQPVLYGALTLAALLIGTPGRDTRDFLTGCAARCTAIGTPAETCARTCQCIADDTVRAGLWEDLLHDRLSADGQAGMTRIIRNCRNPG